jgi:hypothetical protein
MNAFKYGSITACKGHHREEPVIALGNIAVHEWLDVFWHLRIGDTRTMEQRAIERWENEGGEIPNEEKKRASLVKAKFIRPSTLREFFESI